MNIEAKKRWAKSILEGVDSIHFTRVRIQDCLDENRYWHLTFYVEQIPIPDQQDEGIGFGVAIRSPIDPNIKEYGRAIAFNRFKKSGKAGYGYLPFADIIPQKELDLDPKKKAPSFTAIKKALSRYITNDFADPNGVATYKIPVRLQKSIVKRLEIYAIPKSAN